MNRFTMNAIMLAILFLSNLKASESTFENKESSLIQFEKVAISSLTPLMEYSAEGNLVKLKESLALSDNDLNKQDKHGRTALYWAAQNNHAEIIEELLQQKNIEVDLADKEGLTPLAIAVNNGNENAVKVLVRRSNLNARDNKLHYTPLIRAASSGHSEIIKELLNAGANPTLSTIKSDKEVELVDFVSKEDVEMHGLIKAKQAEFDEASRKFLSDGLHQNEATLSTLLKKGLNVNYNKDTDGYTLLHHACANRYVDIVKFLIYEKAHVNAIETAQQWTPLHIARSNKAITQILLQHKADVSSLTKGGENALMLAVLENNLDVAKLLIDAKADVNVVSQYGSSALLYAEQRKFEQMIKLLENSGAKDQKNHRAEF